jgi:signal transduction histidine kinase
MGLTMLEEEIRNSFSLIGSSSKQLLDASKESVVEIVADVSQACSIAVDIVNDLLMYEKIEGGLMQLEKEEVVVDGVVEEVLKLFAMQAKASNIEIIYQNHLDKKVYVEIDSYKMSQVLRNLVSNALKFSKGGSQVVVSLEMVDGLSSQSDAFSSSSFRTTEGNPTHSIYSLESLSRSLVDLSNRVHPVDRERLYDEYRTTSDGRKMVRVCVQDFGAGISEVC